MVNVHNDTNHISCCFLMDSKLKIVITTKDFWVLNMKDMFFFSPLRNNSTNWQSLRFWELLNHACSQSEVSLCFQP